MKPATPPERSPERLTSQAQPASAPQSALEIEKRLLHELQVQQIELEMQNEELRTSQAKAEAVLARYTDLYDCAPLGYFTLQPNGEIAQTNLAGARLLGLERAPLTGRRFGAFVTEADQSVFTAFLPKVFASELRHTCKVDLVSQGGLPPRRVQIDATLSPGGRDCRVVVLDITERTRAESQLRLLEASVAQLNDAVIITEAAPVTAPGPRIVFVNEAAERMTGYTRAELIGQTPRLFQGPSTDQAELRRISAALHQMGSVVAELINYTKAGTEYWIELNITPVLSAAGEATHFVAIERDITARKAAEKRIDDQLAELLRWQHVTIGREKRVQTLKDEVNRLLAAQGQPARYTGPRLSATTATTQLHVEGSHE